MRENFRNGPRKQDAKESVFPMRINKYLAWKKYGTRREADKLIEEKKVFINGKPAELGSKVDETDEVKVLWRGKQKERVYFAYNKPKGVITHSASEEDEDIKEVTQKFPELKDVFPVGRLDKDSYGLIILTNDGRITDPLLNPNSYHEKEYVVRTKDRLRESFKKNMEAGVEIEDYTTKPCKVIVLNDYTFRITLTEGKKHQIRRMVVALHNEVEELERVRILNVKLGNLSPGSYRPIQGEELKNFLSKLGM